MVEPTHLKNITVVKLGKSSPISGVKIPKTVELPPPSYGFSKVFLRVSYVLPCVATRTARKMLENWGHPNSQRLLMMNAHHCHELSRRRIAQSEDTQKNT